MSNETKKTRYDVSYLKVDSDREGKVREHWTKIGVGFAASGGAVMIRLDSLPLHVTGETKFAIFPKEDDRGER